MVRRLSCLFSFQAAEESEQFIAWICLGPLIIFGSLMVILALRASVLNHHFGPQVTASIDPFVSR